MLDTNVAIHLRDSDPATLERLADERRPICLSIVTWIELEAGALPSLPDAGVRRAALDAILEAYPVLPFDQVAAVAYRRILVAAGFSRSKLLDRMIAAQAIAARATLATYNIRDFQDIPALLLEDWHGTP